MKIWVAPTGRLAEGHVLDCARKPLEQALKFYDPCLYVKWNPKKLKGWGCWEVRRRPDEKQVLDVTDYRGISICRVGYKEYDFIHHVMDVPYLNRLILEKLKETDTWAQGNKGRNWVQNLDYREAKAQEKLEEKADAERQYAIKQHRSQIKDFMEYVNSGGHPARIADHWQT